MFGIIMKNFAYVSHNKGVVAYRLVQMAALQKLVAVCALKSRVP